MKTKSRENLEISARQPALHDKYRCMERKESEDFLKEKKKRIESYVEER